MIEGIPPSDPPSNLPVAPASSYVSRSSGGRTPPPFSVEDAERVPWTRYLDAFRRQFWLIALVTLAGSVAGVFVARRVSPLYEAESHVWIVANATSPTTVAAGTQQLLPSSSWEYLMRSYSVVDPVVRQWSLYLTYPPAQAPLFRSFSEDSSFHRPGAYRLKVDSTGNTYTLAPPGPGQPETGTFGDSIGKRFGFVWLPPAGMLQHGQTVDFNVTTPRNESLSLVQRLTVTLPDNNQFLVFRLTDTDPHRAAAILNAWVAQFMRTAADIKGGHRADFRRTVQDQLGIAEKNLNNDQVQLQEFKERTITLPSETVAGAGGDAISTYLQQKATLEEARRSRNVLERMLADAHGGPLKTDGFLSVPSVLNDTPQLKVAMEELAREQNTLAGKRLYETDDVPEVRHLIASVNSLQVETIPGITRDIVQTLRLTENDLTARLAADSTRLKAIPARAIEGTRLANRVAASQTLYNTLQAKFDAVKLADDEIAPDLRLTDPAEAPMLPTSNQAPRLLLMAVLASIGAGVAIGFMRDRLDRRLRYPEQATIELGLTIVGTIPRFRYNKRGEVGIAAMSQVVESFRTLRLAVRYHFPEGQPVVVCVSSAAAGEGKSLTSSNLAVAFANAGQRTVLIDGDVRRGVVHTTFDIDRRPGLVDYLGGTVTHDDIIRPTNTANLSVVASGSRSKRAPELLVNDRLMRLVAAVRSQFDVVIIDSAPFAAGMDAYALAAAAGSILIVLRPGMTDRKLAASKLEVLDRLPVSVIGGVVNGVSPSEASKYYYGYDTKYGLEDIVEETDETNTDARESAPSVPPRLIAKP